MVPYWRLSGFYLCYFASLGAFLPYWSLYLANLGFSAVAIGQLMALMALTKLISPNVWGWIADHTGERMRIVRLGSFAAALCFAGVFFGQGFWWLALVMIAFSFFWNATLPQFEATTLNYLGPHPQRYTSIRIWGSIGFIVAVAGLGPLLDRYGTVPLPFVLLLLFIGIWFSTLQVSEREDTVLPQAHAPIRHVLRQPHVLALFAICFLMQASHGPYYTFYSIYLESHGYSRGLIGQLWAVGVVAEVGVFLVMHRLVPRSGLRVLLLASVALAVLRWLLIAFFVDYVAVLVAAQVLHAATFGVYHGVAIQLVHRYFRGRHQGRGQALYSSLSNGAGGALGAFYSGFTWDSAGATITFVMAALLSGVAWLLAWRALRVTPEQTYPVHDERGKN